MTKSNEIGILRADHVVGLCQAPIETNTGLEIRNLRLLRLTLWNLGFPIGVRLTEQRVRHSNLKVEFQAQFWFQKKLETAPQHDLLGECRFYYFRYRLKMVWKFVEHTFSFNFLVKSLNFPFWAAAPKGRCPVEHRGNFDFPASRSGWDADWRPSRALTEV